MVLSYNIGDSVAAYDVTNAAKKWYYEEDDPTIALVAEDESMLTMTDGASVKFMPTAHAITSPRR